MEFFSPSTMADSFGNVNLGLSSLSFGAENVLLQAPLALSVSFEKPAAVTLMCFPLYVLFFSFSCQYFLSSVYLVLWHDKTFLFWNCLFGVLCASSVCTGAPCHSWGKFSSVVLCRSCSVILTCDYGPHLFPQLKVLVFHGVLFSYMILPCVYKFFFFIFSAYLPVFYLLLFSFLL